MNILPNVEPTTFIFENKRLYVTLEGEKREVRKVGVIANGIHDLCIALDDNGNAALREIAKTPKSRVLYLPSHDILWLTLKEPVVKKYTFFSILMIHSDQL